MVDIWSLYCITATITSILNANILNLHHYQILAQGHQIQRPNDPSGIHPIRNHCHPKGASKKLPPKWRKALFYIPHHEGTPLRNEYNSNDTKKKNKKRHHLEQRDTLMKGRLKSPEADTVRPVITSGNTWNNPHSTPFTSHYWRNRYD